MSFRGDDQRRYGHVPPVQYPVANQSNDHASYPTRRPSFNQGDDAALFGSAQSSSQVFQNAPLLPPPPPARGEEELFLTSPTEPSSSISNFAPSYQNQYQPSSPYQLSSPSSYNPQHFARSQSTSLPYHPAQQPQYSNLIQPSSSLTQQALRQSTTNYTPQAYNPAAYASTAVPQRNATYHGYNNYSSHYAPSQAAYGSPSTAYSPAFPSSSQATTPATPQYENPLPSPPLHNVSSSSQVSSYDPSAYSPSYNSTPYGTYSPNTNSPALTTPYSAASDSAPYPHVSQMPAGPGYSVNDPTSFYNRTSRSNSRTSQLPSPPPQSSSGIQRHPTNAPLPSRPIDAHQDGLLWNSNGAARDDDLTDELLAQDTIIQDIEAELGGSVRRDRPTPINGAQLSDEDIEHLRQYDPNTPTSDPTRASTSVQVQSSASNVRYPYRLEEESDPEGTAGVLAMQQAEMEDRRFSGAPYPHADLIPVPSDHGGRRQDDEESSDSDFGGMDLGLFSGGYAGNLTYGNDVGLTDDRPLPALPSYGLFGGYEGQGGPAQALPQADMDYPGAGGLQPASSYRPPAEDGEEQASLHSRQSGSESPYKDDYPDIFYHPGLSNRPLPALPMLDTLSLQPAATTSQGQYQQDQSWGLDSRGQGQEGLEVYNALSGPAHTQVERSISLTSHTTTPPVQTPSRSRTDAAEERRRQYRQAQHGKQNSASFDYETGSAVTYDMITLPTGRKRKFLPSKLTSQDLKRCAEPWALSSIANWMREMTEGEPDLKKKTIEEGLIKLFTSKVPTMNVADAETLSARVVTMMLESGILVPEEEWVKFAPGSISGVLWQLSASGCYAPKLHECESPGRCYSYHCTRTLKKANLDDLLAEDSVKQEDWATFFKLTKESIEGKHKKEIERQNVLHEIVTSEEGYMNQLEVLRVLYRDRLRTLQPPIIAPAKIDKFLKTVFGKVDGVQETNKDHLLAQLKYRQQEQGPWIVGFSDLFREWIRKARDVYIEYASSYPYATFLVRREADRNILFRQFLEQVRNHKRSERLDWTHFLKTPITRLQRYSFLLTTVEKNMLQDSEEKTNLTKAIQEIHAVTLECDQRVAEMQKKVEMMELSSMLVLRPGFQAMLHLDHLGRELLFQGDLQRMGSKGVRWVETHALLFDHYLILAKTVSLKDGRGEKKYDVSKEVSPRPALYFWSDGR